MNKWGIWLLLFLVSLQQLEAQEKTSADTVFFLAKKKGLLGKIGKSLSVNNPDILLPAEGAVKNEAVFNPFRGKIIRQVLTENTGFNKSVNDTSLDTRNLFNDIGNKLHPGTNQKVIRKNLFFSPGDSLYPYLLADNERFLRELSYLQDARIQVRKIPGNPDSVDVIVITKDVFPLGGSLEEGSEKSARFELNDDNLLGSGNKIRIRNLYDAARTPGYGLGFEFLKRNIVGSFINLTMGYRNESPAFNSLRREENNLYILGDLPLVSPYHAWTGGFEIARHFTRNSYLGDSLYQSDYKYSYRIFDGWVGYNIGARKQLTRNLKSRLKRILAVRGIHRRFLSIPDIYQIKYDSRYTNLVSVLGSLTFFEQDYYHTNFLYGFGRNEDVPEGFSLSLIGGWTNRNDISRPYVGFEYNRNYFSQRKNYLNYTLKLGTYYNNQGTGFEDMSLLTSIDYFTKLRKLGIGKWYLRHFISGSFTQLARTKLNDPLRLTSDYGIPELSNPTDLEASTRVTLNAESVFYNTWKFVGFSFAPFSFAGFTYLKSIGRNVNTGDIYSAVGAGVRTRNENLVFGTMELKAYYYPRISGTMNQWNITFNTDLRFKYNSQLFKKPDFAVLN